MSKRKYYIILTIILIISIIIRIYKWPNSINDINCDEAMTAINANSIAEDGVDIYGTTYPVYFESWIYGGQSAFPTYVLAFFIRLFGFSDTFVRLPILLISIIGIVFTILLVDKIFKNKTLNLIVGILLAINPWHILQSAWVLDCNFFPHIMVIAIYCLLSGIEDKKTVLLYISMFIFALTLYSYGIALYLTPIFLIIVAIYLLKKHIISINKLLFCILIFLLFATPIILMTVINLFDLPTIKIGKLTIQNFEYSVRTDDMLIFANDKFQTLLENSKYLFKILFLQIDGLIWNAFPGFGTIYLISMPIIIGGIIAYYFNNKKKSKQVYTSKTGIIILYSWTIIGLACGILINGININRINIIWYILIIWNAIAIYQLMELTKYKKVCISLIGVLYLISFITFAYYYKTQAYQIANSYTFSRGLVNAIEYVDNLEEDKIILSYNICDTDKEDVFIRYATKGNQKEKNMNKREFFFIFSGQLNMDFSTNEKQYIIEEINNDIKLEEKIYVIDKKECENINNIFDYEVKEFNNYTVLIRK